LVLITRVYHNAWIKKCKALVLSDILVLSDNIHIGDRRCCLLFWQQLEIFRL